MSNVRILALEVYKTLNNLNPVFMKDYFVPKTTGHNPRLKNPLDIPKARTSNNGVFKGLKSGIHSRNQ